MLNTSYWLTNVRLEQGYAKVDGQVVGTHTKICHVRIDGGAIAEIIGSELEPQGPLPKYDCKEFLLLPSFEEAHIHLDKTYYDGPWKAVKKFPAFSNGLKKKNYYCLNFYPWQDNKPRAF